MTGQRCGKWPSSIHSFTFYPFAEPSVFYTPIHYAWPYPTGCRPLPLPRRFSVRGHTHAWKPHILNITNKANSTLGFVKRNLHDCPQKVKDQAYKKSTLEYGCTASGIRIEHTRNHGSNRSSTGQHASQQELTRRRRDA